MDHLVECFESVSNGLVVYFSDLKYIFELGYHAIKNSNSDLLGVNIASHGVLQVGVSHLERLVHNVMFVGLHYLN